MEKESSETVQGAEALPQETEKIESEMSEPIKIPLVSKELATTHLGAT